MPEIKSDSKPEEEQDQQESEGISEEERQRILSDFEAKIEAGEWGGQPFHNTVKAELYPLIGEDALSTEEFTRLVQLWAVKNNPHDWMSRDFTFHQTSKN